MEEKRFLSVFGYAIVDVHGVHTEPTRKGERTDNSVNDSSSIQSYEN